MRGLLKTAVAVLIAVGVLARLSPLIDFEGRLPWQYMSEDGYLMQTIARNMAIGLGMSTAEGTIPTNGVQPLATFFFAGLFLLVGGDKIGGVALITVFSTLVSIGAAWVYYQLLRRLLADFNGGRELAAFAAAGWFTGPLLIRHTMNGLETGVYYLVLALTLYYYVARPVRESGALAGAERVVFGLLLGVCFLARNDAVFFIGAILLIHLAVGPAGGRGARLVDCLVAGVLSVVVASPWLIYNQTNFGSIIPISGTAQSHSSLIGQNLVVIPSAMFESGFLYAPLPRSIEHTWPVMIGAVALLVFTLVTLWRGVSRASLPGRRFFLTYVVFGACVCGYYGLFFGAPHFISRYLSPQSLLWWMAATVTVVTVARWLAAKVPAARALVPLAAAAAVASGVFGAAYQFRHGHQHLHKQVVAWAAANITRENWAGAVQTGTLGFFHDRTINLDGKVNPEALAVIRRDKHVLEYVVDSKVEYVIDWVGIGRWPEYTHQSQRLHDQFEVVVMDPKRNLAVLKRKSLAGRPQ